MLNSTISLSIAFILGALISYTLVSKSTAEHDISLENTITSTSTVAQKSAGDKALSGAIKHQNDNKENTESQLHQEELARLQAKINELKIIIQSLDTTLVPNAEPLAENETSVKALNEKLHQFKAENLQLKQQLKILQPSPVSNEDIKALFPEEIGEQLSYTQGEMREDIFEYHQLAEDLDWGYIKQQEIYNFIISHPNSNLIKITSLSCKIDTCELILEEKNNLERLNQLNLTPDEIEEIIATEQPAYKSITEQLPLQPQLNLMPRYTTHSRFYTYNIFKDKNALYNQFK